MNIFELGAVLGVFAGAYGGYHFVAPYSVVLGVLAAGIGAGLGFFVGHFGGFLVLLPFEAAARLGRFITTGHWTDPRFRVTRRARQPDGKG